MVRPSYRKQKEIERLIIFDVFRDEDAPESWGDLWSKAKEKGLTSPTTLSDYLKRLEHTGYVTRSVDSRARPPKSIYKLVPGARVRWQTEKDSRVPIAVKPTESSKQETPLEAAVVEPPDEPSARAQHVLSKLLPVFNPLDEDNLVDSGILEWLAGKVTKDPMLLIYADPTSERLLKEKIMLEDSEIHSFFTALHDNLLRGFAKQRMRAMEKTPRPPIATASPSEQASWLKDAFDFEVTITFKLNGRDVFDMPKLTTAIERLSEHIRRSR